MCECTCVCCSDCEEGDVDIKVAVLFVVWSRSDGLRSRGARSEVTRQLLGAGVLPPDVQHEDWSDEEQTHHQHWYGADFEAGRVLRVEAPHAAGACRPRGPATAACAAAGGFPLPDCGACCPGSHRLAGGPARCPDIGWNSCWYTHFLSLALTWAKNPELLLWLMSTSNERPEIAVWDKISFMVNYRTPLLWCHFPSYFFFILLKDDTLYFSRFSTSAAQTIPNSL